MTRQPYREVPRWQRSRQKKAAQLVLSKRDSRMLARQIAAQAAAQPPPAQPGNAAERGAHHPAFRYRRQLVPLWWLTAAVIAGPVLHHFHRSHPGVLIGLAGGASIWLASRHRKGTDRSLRTVMAALTALWVPVLAETGTGKPWPAVAFASWAILTFCWCKYYRVRPEDIAAASAPKQDHAELWAQTLGAKGPLAGSRLISPEKLPRGGLRYVIDLKRGEQDSGVVFSQAKRVASLFARAVTEAYAERFPDGREHQVMLTLLKRATVPPVRLWDGDGIDSATGLAVIGDYPDGTPAHFRFWSPRNGCEQSVVVGVKGSGKSYLFHLLLSIAVSSEVPVIPIVLDPQQGQSLPDWSDQVIYAKGPAECFRYLKAFEAGMTARSDYLSSMAWTDEDGYERPGMDFFDPHMARLPIIFLVFDEAHIVFKDKTFGTQAIEIVGNCVKLDRKAGGHLVIASHALLLTEMGDSTLRSMVVGGNAVALRTGENFSGAVIGLEADPKLLPKTFADGSPTNGIGYIAGPDNKPDSWMRLRLVKNPRKAAVDADVAGMDPVFRAAWDASLASTGDVATQPQSVARRPQLASVPDADDEPVTEGRSCADAILAVLEGEMTKGEIMSLAAKLVTGEWGRRKPFTARAFSDAFARLVTEGRITKPKHNTYAPARPSLTVVGGTGGSRGTAS